MKDKTVVVVGCGPHDRKIAGLIRDMESCGSIEVVRKKPKNLAIVLGELGSECLTEIEPKIGAPCYGPKRKRGKGNKYHR